MSQAAYTPPPVFSALQVNGFTLYWSTVTSPYVQGQAMNLRDFDFRLPDMAQNPPPVVTATITAEDPRFSGGAYSVSQIIVNFGLNLPQSQKTQVRIRAEAPPNGAQDWTFRCNLTVLGKAI